MYTHAHQVAQLSHDTHQVAHLTHYTPGGTSTLLLFTFHFYCMEEYILFKMFYQDIIHIYAMISVNCLQPPVPWNSKDPDMVLTNHTGRYNKILLS